MHIIPHSILSMWITFQHTPSILYHVSMNLTHSFVRSTRRLYNNNLQWVNWIEDNRNKATICFLLKDKKAESGNEKKNTHNNNAMMQNNQITHLYNLQLVRVSLWPNGVKNWSNMKSIFFFFYFIKKINARFANSTTWHWTFVLAIWHNHTYILIYKI